MDVQSLVHDWLLNRHNGHWTMVLDNLDDESVILPTSKEEDVSSKHESVAGGLGERSLLDYIPTTDHGSIVITTRSHQVASQLIEYAEDIIDVDAMTEQDATALFSRKLARVQPNSDPEQLKLLVRELDCMPLAIMQAAAYITQSKGRTTVMQYYAQLVRSDSDREVLLRKHSADSRRDIQASNSILITWHISFEHIRRQRQSAADLLALMSFFSGQAIATIYVRGQYHNAPLKESSVSGVKDGILGDYDFEDDIAVLLAHGMVGVGADDQSLNIHRLVQHSTRVWLDLHGKLDFWRMRYIDVLNDRFPATGDYENWPECQALFPHLEALLHWSRDGDHRMSRCSDILLRGSWYALRTERYTVAEEMARESMDTRAQLFGMQDERTLAAANDLALALRGQGKYTDSEQLFREGLRERERTLGPSHPSALESANNLAMTMEDQGKYEDAEKLYRQVLAGLDNIMSPSRSDMMGCVNNFLLLLCKQAKYTEAEDLVRQQLDKLEVVLGPDHPTTILCLGDLGTILHMQEKYDEAITLLRQALTRSRQVLGQENPDTLEKMTTLALLLNQQGQKTEAEELAREALAKSEEKLGPNHSKTLTFMNVLAVILRGQGVAIEAEELLRLRVTRSSEALGLDHPDTLDCVNNLATALLEMDKYGEAEELFRRAVASMQRALGLSHPSTLRTKYNLVMTLGEQEKLTEASRLFEQVIGGCIGTFGTSHPMTILVQKNQEQLNSKIKESGLQERKTTSGGTAD